MKNGEKETKETKWRQAVCPTEKTGSGDVNKVTNRGRKHQETCIIVVHYQSLSKAKGNSGVPTGNG